MCLEFLSSSLGGRELNVKVRTGPKNKPMSLTDTPRVGPKLTQHNHILNNVTVFMYKASMLDQSIEKSRKSQSHQADSQYHPSHEAAHS